jgi:hypothetical protein
MSTMKNHGFVVIIPAAMVCHWLRTKFIVSGTRYGGTADRARSHVTGKRIAGVRRWHLTAVIVSRNDGHRHVTSTVTLIANCCLLMLQNHSWRLAVTSRDFVITIF